MKAEAIQIRIQMGPRSRKVADWALLQVGLLCRYSAVHGVVQTADWRGTVRQSSIIPQVRGHSTRRMILAGSWRAPVGVKYRMPNRWRLELGRTQVFGTSYSILGTPVDPLIDATELWDQARDAHSCLTGIGITHPHQPLLKPLFY